MRKIISWLIPIGMLIMAFIIPFIPLSPEEEQVRKDASLRKTFVQNRKDTIAEFGNARFVILRAYDKNHKQEYWILYDNLNYAIENKVNNFTKVDSHVYTIGEKGYTKLNYETAELIQSEDISIFSKKDKLIFENFK